MNQHRPPPSEPLRQLFIDFCESSFHLDSLLSRIEPHLKTKLSTTFGAFLRRPITIANHFGVDLHMSSDEFWEMNFIKLKKFPPIYRLFEILWERGPEIPTEGGVQDFPPEMIARWVRDWGEENTKIYAKILTQSPLTTVRFNRRAIEREAEMREKFKLDEFPKMREGRYGPFARVFKGYAPVLKSIYFEEGLYEIQDEGSQVMAAFALLPEAMSAFLSDSPATHKKDLSMQSVHQAIQALKPMTVIDACAGAGGKTLALADLLKGNGRVYGYDIYEKKIHSLRRRAERAQERNIQGVILSQDVEERRAFLKAHEGTADVVLVDSPCSGQGVLRRNPDAKWNRKPKPMSLDHSLPMNELQHLVMQDYAGLVKPGGRLVFGVCSFEKAETIEQVKWIQENFPQLKLTHSGYIGPFETDGFYMASFIRKS